MVPTLSRLGGGPWARGAAKQGREVGENRPVRLLPSAVFWGARVAVLFGLSRLSGASSGFRRASRLASGGSRGLLGGRVFTAWASIRIIKVFTKKEL